ncbi:Collagen [uncultured virus]|nr:Collagen [uncultured virus]
MNSRHTKDNLFYCKWLPNPCSCPKPPFLPGPTGPTGPSGQSSSTGPTGPGCEEPLPTFTRIVYVNKGGNDATADGSECFPFLTVTAAMASITDAIAPFPDPNNITKRYAINIGPGEYIEGQLGLKANVQLIGVSTLLTRLLIPFILDPLDLNWGGGFSNDPRSGFVDLTLLAAPLDFNFTMPLNPPNISLAGKLFFVSTNIIPTPVFTAASTSVNQVNIRDSLLSSGYTQNGINMIVFSSFVPSGDITINSQLTTDTQVALVSGGINGNVIINAQPGHIPIDTVYLESFAITENVTFNPFPNSGRLIVNAVGAQPPRIFATVDSIPIFNPDPVLSRILLNGSVNFIRVNDAFGLAYTPSVSANWVGAPPTTVQEALDRIAAALGPI